MEQDLNLLIGIASIAGVFVGFGALISVIQQSDIEASQLELVRVVVTIGLVVIVVALIPIVLIRYGITGHSLWFTCSLIFLIFNWTIYILSLRTREDREAVITRARANPVATATFFLLLEVPMQVPLFLTVLGLFPDLEPAFYITSLVFNLFQAAFVLARLVYMHESPINT